MDEYCRLLGFEFPKQDGWNSTEGVPGLFNQNVSLIARDIPVALAVIEKDFTPQAVSQRNHQLLSRFDIHIAGKCCTCFEIAPPEQETTDNRIGLIWTILVPHESSTSMLVLNFGKTAVDQSIKEMVTSWLQRVRMAKDPMIPKVHRSFDFECAGPFAIAHEVEQQLFLSEGGQFPALQAGSPLISMSWIPIRLFQQQFLPYLSQRLQTLKVNLDTASLTPLSSFVYATRGVIPAQPEMVFHARYFFHPEFVLNCELTASQALYEQCAPSVLAIFDSVRIHATLHQEAN